MIDLIVNPFRPEMHAGPYGTTHHMRDALTKLGVFDHAHSAGELVTQMDAAGVEQALIPSSTGGVANVDDIVAEIVTALTTAGPNPRPERPYDTRTYLVLRDRGTQA